MAKRMNTKETEHINKKKKPNIKVNDKVVENNAISNNTTENEINEPTITETNQRRRIPSRAEQNTRTRRFERSGFLSPVFNLFQQSEPEISQNIQSLITSFPSSETDRSSQENDISSNTPSNPQTSQGNDDNSNAANPFIVRIDMSFSQSPFTEEVVYEFLFDSNSLNSNSTRNIFNENNNAGNNSVNSHFSYFELFEFISFIRRQSNRRRKVSKEDLGTIKIEKYKKKEDDEDCGICMDTFKENERVRVLDCKHFYHCKCVDKWFLNFSTQCPICKKEVISSKSDDKETI